MSSLRTLNLLFSLAMDKYRHERRNRLKGKHCVARLLRGQAKRKAAGKTTYDPWRTK